MNDLRFCTRILDEINYSCDGTSVVQTEAGEAYGLDKVALTHVESVTVEHENQVQVSINKVMSYLKQVKYKFSSVFTPKIISACWRTKVLLFHKRGRKNSI